MTSREMPGEAATRGDKIYFCVDAGATRSRGRLYDAAGAALATAEAGPANASYHREQAAASIGELWARLCSAAGRDPADFSSAVFSIGGAGIFIPRVREPFVALCPPFAAIVTMSDGYAALIGAGGGAPCGLLSVGTGVAAHRLFDDGASIQRDGWGWVVGDRGGGCWLGMQALRHAMEVWDGLSPSSALSKAALERFGGAQGLLDGSLANLDAQRLAAFAPLVLEQAENGCPVAGDILSRAIGYLAALVGVLDCAGAPLYLSGGLAGPLKAKLVARIARDIRAPAGDAMEGCLLVARGDAPPENAIFG